MVIFISFHIFLILFIISLSRTFFSNPGYFDKEYENLFSIIKFVKNLFIYFTKWREPEFKFNEMMNNYEANLIKDLEEIKNLKPILSEKLAEFSSSIGYVSRYNSIDVTKKNILQDNEEIDNKEKHAISLSLSEDILESFENELENFIKANDIYEKFNNLIFYDKSKENNRFCGFCLVKKVNKNIYCKIISTARSSASLQAM